MSGDGSAALADFRRRVADLYAGVRGAEATATAWGEWRRGRDTLFATHPLSPLEGATPRPSAMLFWAYDPTWRLRGRIVPSDDIAPILLATDGGEHHFDGIGRVRFERNGSRFDLPIYWSSSYGGGLFLPFRDATNGVETFGSGRYLLDGAKSADLGGSGEDVVLDFNFSYHPSCVWGSWVCPLAPIESGLEVAVRAGECKPDAPAAQPLGSRCERYGCGAFVYDGAAHDCC